MAVDPHNFTISIHMLCPYYRRTPFGGARLTKNDHHALNLSTLVTS